MTERALERIIDALHGRNLKVRMIGSDKAEAQCPAHEDGKPSLGLQQIPDKALVFCQAYCDTADVMAALGLVMSDLFDNRKSSTYVYTDPSGQPTRLTHRAYRGQEKRFWQGGDKQRVDLYRLPQVIEAVAAGRPVFLVEGEQDVLALETLNVVATTAPQGARNFHKVDVSHLKGAQVIAIPDRDASGEEWAAEVRRRLDGYAGSLEFMTVKVGKDPADHVAAGYGLDDLTTVEQGDRWDDPLPLGWRTDLLPFPTDALPPVLREYVRALSAEIQTPEDMAGTAALGIGHACIGGRVRVQARPGYVEPTNQYAVLVAPPASRKSKVVAECREPLDEAEQRLQLALANKIEDLRVKRQILDGYAEKAAKAAANSGEQNAIDNAVAAARVARQVVVPPHPRLVMGDSSPENLVRLLGEHGRLAAISAEAGMIDSLVGRHSKKSNLDPLLKAHAGDRLDNETLARGVERSDRPALTVVMSIQPYALHAMTQDIEAAGRGLIARPMWSLTPDIVGTRRWDGSVPAPERVKRAYHTLVTDLAVAMALRDNTVTILLDDAASKVLGEYHDRMERMMAPGGEYGAGLIREWVGKLVGAVARMAAVFHVMANPPQMPEVDSFGQLGALPSWDPGTIAEATVRDAIRLGDYFLAHAVAAFSGSEDRRAPAGRQLITWLIAHEVKAFTAREVQRKGPRPLRKIDVLSQAIEYLATIGWVRAREGRGYELHPDAKTLATAATTATSRHDGDVSAGQDMPPMYGGASPEVATPGDYSPASSPGVARMGDNSTEPMTSRNSGLSPLVAAVAKDSSDTWPEPEPTCPDCRFPLGSNGHYQNCRSAA